MRWSWVVLFGLQAGGTMGLVTSLMGLSPSVEPWVWMAHYAVWAVLCWWRQLPGFRTALASSFLSGLVCGPVQVALMTRYRANNPWYAEAFQSGDATATTLVAQSIVMGFLFGVFIGIVVGGAQAARDWWRG